MKKKEVDQRYYNQHSALEVEFFDIVPDGKGQKRQLKAGRTIEEFNQKHTKNQQSYETELIAEGFMEAPEPYVEPEPEMDYKAEILKLKAEVEILKEAKNGT